MCKNYYYDGYCYAKPSSSFLFLFTPLTARLTWYDGSFCLATKIYYYTFVNWNKRVKWQETEWVHKKWEFDNVASFQHFFSSKLTQLINLKQKPGMIWCGVAECYANHKTRLFFQTNVFLTIRISWSTSPKNGFRMQKSFLKTVPV